MINRFRIFLFAVTCFALTDANAQGAYPAENQSYFENGSVIESRLGKLAAIEGVILRIAKGPKDKPMYQVSLPPPVSTTIWVASLFSDSNGVLEVGDNLRVLGFLQTVKSDDSWTASVTTDKAHMLGFCFIDIPKEKSLFLPAGIEQCKEWRSGTIPEQ
ncbi:hypothetical protein [Solimonas marina]|uniref:tRNA_anti-like n=1 Tax=Solimonas marina TaxID=2714601 RepID=A0A970BBE2_9GAMM|nr:hypothetical protein [Solimonas marina]NKF24321.1 hypothetical protein [Solimonas marina]